MAGRLMAVARGRAQRSPSQKRGGNGEGARPLGRSPEPVPRPLFPLMGRLMAVARGRAQRSPSQKRGGNGEGARPLGRSPEPVPRPLFLCKGQCIDLKNAPPHHGRWVGAWRLCCHGGRRSRECMASRGWRLAVLKNADRREAFFRSAGRHLRNAVGTSGNSVGG